MIPETITCEQAAERYHCHYQSIRKAIKAGKIVAYRPGKNIQIDLESGDKWFYSTKQQPSSIIGRPRTGTKRR